MSGTGCIPAGAKLEEFRGYLADLATELLSERVALAVRLLSDYGDRAALFDTSVSLGDQELRRGPGSSSTTRCCWPTTRRPRFPKPWPSNLRALRNPADNVQFELLVVSSVEDAITAVALNGEIQAAIIRHDMPLRRRERLPLMTHLLGSKNLPVVTDRTHDWVECGEWIRELRPHIDLYLLTDESIAAATDEDPDVYDRTFYRLNDVTDLHTTVLAGMRRPVRDTVLRRAARLRRRAGRAIPRPAGRARRQHLQLEVAAGHGGVLRPQHLHGRDVDDLGRAGFAAGPARQPARRRWTRPRRRGIPI